MMNVKCTIAYLGTKFLGWQKTAAGPSVEEALESAISRVLQQPISLQAASRTDRGVHAVGQVVNFFAQSPIASWEKLRRGINALLPPEISLLEIQEAEPTFHPTLSSAGKEYHYHICLATIQSPFHRHTSWHIRAPLALDKMRQGCSLFLGTNDLSAFCNEVPKNPYCEISLLELEECADNRVRITIRGNRFLYKMARNIVGTLVYIGSHKLSLASLPSILADKDRTRAGITAPAHGLLLHKVFY